MGAKVFTIERQKSLFANVAKFLPTMGYTIKTFYGDGYKGLPAFAPFDKILVTAGAPFIPEPLTSQLKVGGILVIPVGASDVQIMTSITRKTETEYVKQEHGTFRFVPLLENKASD